MKKNIALALAIALPMLLFTGCRSSTEINAMAIVMGIAVDRGEKEREYEVTAQIARASALGGGSSKTGEEPNNSENFLNITKTGNGVGDAMLGISQMLNRKFYTGHIQVIVISRDVAEEGLGPILDHFIGSADGRLSTPLLISEGRARDMFEGNDMLNHGPAANLAELIEAQAKTGEVVEATIESFLTDIIGGHTAATLPIGMISEDDGGGEFAKLTGVAAFDGLKLKDVMTIEQSRAVIAVRDEISGGFFTVEKDGKYLTLHLEKTSLHIKSELQKGKPKIDVRIVREYSVDDATWEFDYLDDDERKNAEKVSEEQALKQLNDTLEWAKEHKLDVFAFGERLYRYHYSETKQFLSDWPNAFPELEVEFNVEITILGSGAILKSLEPAK